MCVRICHLMQIVEFCGEDMQGTLRFRERKLVPHSEQAQEQLSRSRHSFTPHASPNQRSQTVN